MSGILALAFLVVGVVLVLALGLCRVAMMSDGWHLDDDGHYRRRV